LGQIVKNIKTKHPDVPVQYHSHAGPGFAMASILEVCKAGCDYVDVGMEPLSWGTGHPDVLAVQAMLKDAGFKVPEINMEAYMKARSLTQEFMDDFLGYYIPQRNRFMNSLLIAPGLPGGMMGSLMNDLADNLESINRYFEKNGKPKISQEDLMIKLFDEVAYVWPKVGFPPLVTPFSQYVKNLSLMNVMQMLKGKERWSIIADDIWGMILGKSGKLPGEVAPEIKELAKAQGREFVSSNPQDAYPDALDTYRQKMKEKGWETGEDDEELFEYAMHEPQYENYRSGKAKADFEADLAAKKAAKNKTTGEIKSQSLVVEVNGEKYTVSIAPDDGKAAPAAPAAGASPAAAAAAGPGVDVLSPLEGKFSLVKNASETPVKVGDVVKKGQTLGYIEAMKTYNAVAADCDGTVTAICVNAGDKVYEDDVLFKIG
jgi:pyruvate carboxylase subunit B